MEINRLLHDKKMSVYKLSKDSGIPYATVNDICNGKTSLEKCSGETIYKIAKTLNVSMEDILTPYLQKRVRFDNFKSSVCHRLKVMGDINFIIHTLESHEIRTCFERKWFPECFYLLAMTDYISRENNIPLCSEYNDLRTMKLEKTVYPSSIRALAAATNSDEPYEQSVQNSIPEFLKYNIVENEVRKVA